MMCAETIKTDKEKPPVPPKPKDFSSPQMNEFKKLLCNCDAERDSLSNVLDLWDSIPRYVVSRQQQEKWRKAGTFPLLVEVPFRYRGRDLNIAIQPCAIKGRDGIVRNYLPSANEELVEDVLRKIAADKDCGYYDASETRAGVVFTLYMVRKELARRGHTRSYNEIILSLEVMARTTVITTTADKKGKGFSSHSNILTNMNRVTKDTLAEDPKATWFADFNRLASRAFDDLTYRQFNYARLMSHKTQLARWLNKVLSLKYLNANVLNSFEIRFSTITRDSGLLGAYGRPRDALAAVDDAFAELTNCQPPLLARTPDKQIIYGEHRKIEDVVYTLYPSREFVAEIKAASKRQALAEQNLNSVDKSVDNLRGSCE
ncbi:hypothetical protein [uncultured Thiodictyon sp.]|uniref:hypothetical protein n=1 Tax=uncultured Thiodictyon sp. TaxID=1846217 RepID=UPI0025E692B3|nr:hypothetical protein [uncultured Thiodictyon sp.]